MEEGGAGVAIKSENRRKSIIGHLAVDVHAWLSHGLDGWDVVDGWSNSVDSWDGVMDASVEEGGISLGLPLAKVSAGNGNVSGIHAGSRLAIDQRSAVKAIAPGLGGGSGNSSEHSNLKQIALTCET